MLNAIGYQVQYFRNVDDSDWIKLGRVTAFVGCNESGKTTLLKALHKFNRIRVDSPQLAALCKDQSDVHHSRMF